MLNLLQDLLRRLLPFERLRRFFVMHANVATNFIPKLLDTGEDAPVERSPLELREPALHGVEPRRTGRSEVKMESRMLLLKLLDLRGLVRAVVVEDQMQIQIRVRRLVDLAKKFQELLGAVPFCNTTDHFARRDVERGVETCGPMTLVVVGSPFDLSGPQRQHGLRPVQGLDLSFLVDRKHHGVGWRIHVKADDIDDFLGEGRIVADLESLESVWFEIRRRPNLADLPLGNPGILGHQADAPMRRFFRNALGSEVEHLLGDGLVDLRGPSGPLAIRKIVDPFFLEPASPAANGFGMDVELLGDGFGGHAIGAEQSDFGAKSDAPRCLGCSQQAFEDFSVLVGEVESSGWARHA